MTKPGANLFLELGFEPDIPDDFGVQPQTGLAREQLVEWIDLVGIQSLLRGLPINRASDNQPVDSLLTPLLSNEFACEPIGQLRLGGLRSLFSDKLREVFPGTPEIAGGYMYANEKPGWGIDIAEKAAARNPYKDAGHSRGNDHRMDGTIVKP